MKDMLVYPIGSTPACGFAAEFLKKAGVMLTDHPAPEVTHLLLDVPSFGADGKLRGGGDIREILRMLPPKARVAGGNLVHSALEGYSLLDLLQDEEYLALNAAITADCALQVAREKLAATFADSPALIIGWGRIGKCLGNLLKAVGTEVIIAARKESDRAMARALGFWAVDMEEIRKVLPGCRVVFNTAPEMVLYKEDTRCCSNCLLIDLASKPGIEGEHVIAARGLPGIYAPESSGRRIAEAFLRLTRRDLG